MESLKINKHITIHTTQTEEIQSYNPEYGESIHLSDTLYKDLLATNPEHNLIHSPGFVISNVRENLDHFLQTISSAAPCHEIVSHRILIHNEEKTALTKLQSKIFCNNS